MTQPSKLQEFKQLLMKSERVVFFTGAGVSTESGIPDFRSPGTGIWNKISPIDFQEFLASEERRTKSWRRKFTGRDLFTNAQPNKGHLAIERLIRSGKATAVITQNVDNLHQQSGIQQDQVIELHGNAHFAKCLSCEKRYEFPDLKTQFEEFGCVKPCPDCGGIIKTATISFGQQMPLAEVRRAEAATVDCDLFVVVGSSLVVYPAASLPELAAQLGTPLVILNREATPLDDLATLVLNEEIGPTLEEVTKGLN